MITKLEELITAVKGRPKKRIVVAYAQDAHTIEAVNVAVDMGIVDATLVGDPEEIQRVCMALEINPAKFTLVAGGSDVACVSLAVKMVNDGEADVLMKGLVSTDKYMRGILNKEYGLLPPKGVLSHVTVFELPMYHKLLVVSDVAVIPYPDLSQKTAIVRYLTATAKVLGVERPKIAAIAPSEQLLASVQSSVEAAVLAKMADRGQLGDVVLDGPLALDVALFEEVARTKRLSSPVAGDADCLLMPNLDAANVFFKSANHLCNASLAAMVAGTKAPCVLTSRGDSAESKLYSIALAALSAK